MPYVACYMAMEMKNRRQNISYNLSQDVLDTHSSSLYPSITSSVMISAANDISTTAVDIHFRGIGETRHACSRRSVLPQEIDVYGSI